ncbi:hypothetical protein [Geoglobus acetivorans]|uniref:Uncharacterized protein n=1 Tax=Geoglobus acetivorans TaxID=565033 RepID=A0A0A7GDN2_GEOAI|nr:hypothetical protein GACE_0895 [Geoglobus acetivorans]
MDELKEIFERTKQGLLDCFDADFTEPKNIRRAEMLFKILVRTKRLMDIESTS